jgi:hypothetical protein
MALRRLCGCAAHPRLCRCLGCLFTGPLRQELKSLNREKREALLLAILEDTPQDMQCALLECEHHDHSR